MITTSRRTILKSLAAAGLLGALPSAGISRMVFAATPSTKPILVILHLRGGCDGLNLISPATDSNFVNARISDLRVAADGATPGYALKNGPDQNIDFRLHPSAGGLNELYNQGQLAFIHACGLTNATRSHFVATDMIEHGVGSDKDLARTSSGWLTRMLGQEQSTQSAIRAASANGAISNDLAEFPYAMAIPDLGNGLPPIGGAQITPALWQLYADQSGLVANAGQFALQLSADLDVRVPRDAQGHVMPYQAEGGANYDPAAEFGRPLKTVAELIKMDIGLEVLTMDYGDWDMHENQPGRFRPQVEKLSNGLAAFWNDMHAYHDRLVLVTLTEFGRRLRSNKSNGTDHGRASLMMLLGGHIGGGRFYGRWPGLKSEQLDEGVDLAVTTDYRQVLTEILAYRSGGVDKNWFPDYGYQKSLGLFI